MLKKVVLPAPFGPIRPTIAPSGIVKSTPLTATSPPKRRTTPRASSRGVRRRRGLDGAGRVRRHTAVGQAAAVT